MKIAYARTAQAHVPIITIASVIPVTTAMIAMLISAAIIMPVPCQRRSTEEGQTCRRNGKFQDNSMDGFHHNLRLFVLPFFSMAIEQRLIQPDSVR